MSDLVPLDSIFDVAHGHGLDLNKMVKLGPEPDAIAFIGRSAAANGLAAFVGRVLGVEPYKAGLITVALGGSALASFVQPRPFYTAQNVDVLTPKTPMSLETKLFYCLCIEANRFRYSTYGREANRTLRSLPVPALSSVPPWLDGSGAKALSDLSGQLSDLMGKGETDEPLGRDDRLKIEAEPEDAMKALLSSPRQAARRSRGSSGR